MKPAKRENFKTSVGGQAVMEGVMMRGPERWCLAVRTPEGEIVTEEHEVKKRPWARWPFVRGVFSFVDSMLMGYRTLMRSAELSMGETFAEEEASKFDKWVERRFGAKAMNAVMAVSAVLGVALAVLLFMFLPTAFVNFLGRFGELGYFKALIEGGIKIGVFLLYLALVSRMKEIRRVFSYHGAEHKTIYCYEAGDELTVENVRGHSRFHPRCGTSFIFIVLILSILVNSLLPWPAVAGGAFVRVGLKLLMLPLIMSLSFEIIRFAGRHDNVLTRIVSAPGMWVQRLTTREPDDGMIEVAVAAVTPVLPENKEEAAW